MPAFGPVASVAHRITKRCGQDVTVTCWYCGELSIQAPASARVKRCTVGVLAAPDGNATFAHLPTASQDASQEEPLVVVAPPAAEMTVDDIKV